MQFFNRCRWAGPPLLPSPPASTAGEERRTRSCSCALPRSSTSSSWWWQDSTGSSRLGRCSGSTSATVLNLATILKIEMYTKVLTSGMILAEIRFIRKIFIKKRNCGGFPKNLPVPHLVKALKRFRATSYSCCQFGNEFPIQK